MENMNDYASWRDIGEKESVATYTSHSGDIFEELYFSLKCIKLCKEEVYKENRYRGKGHNGPEEILPP